ncbi:hypothetical protein [Hyalangium versicolor]|uniref:hypothetical protein n=1 Tax=Hyalangium versicolor TaxID=2861190 RepID=UPI001CCBB152|nr:hypothetical protein [Hyalangium versicolor]
MSPLVRLGLLILFWAAPRASAGPSTVRLDYIRDATASDCVTQEALHQSLSTLLGRDPIDDSAPERLRLHVSREGGNWRGTVELFDAAGKRKGRRELSSSLKDCQELRQSLELTVALILAPPFVGKPEAPLPAPLPVQSAPPPVQSAPPPVQSAPPPSLPQPGLAPGITVGLGTRLSWGLLPERQLGLDAEGGLRFERFSFSLGATAWLPRAYRLDSAGLRSTLVTATARACVHSGPFGACPQLSVGLLRGEGVDLENAKRVSAPWFSPGARLFVEWSPPVRGIRLQMFAEGQLVLTRHQFLAGDVRLWQVPAWGGSMGLMALWKKGP